MKRLLLFCFLLTSHLQANFTQKNLQEICAKAKKIPSLQFNEDGSALAFWIENKTPFYAVFNETWSEAQKVPAYFLEDSFDIKDEYSFVGNFKKQAALVLTGTKNRKHYVFPIMYINDSWKEYPAFEVKDPFCPQVDLEENGKAYFLGREGILAIEPSSVQLNYRPLDLDLDTHAELSLITLSSDTHLIFWKAPFLGIESGIIKGDDVVISSSLFSNFQNGEFYSVAASSSKTNMALALRATLDGSLEYSFLPDLENPMWEEGKEIPNTNWGEKISSPLVMMSDKQTAVAAWLVHDKEKRHLMAAFFEAKRGWCKPLSLCTNKEIDHLQLVRSSQDQAYLLWEVGQKPRIASIVFPEPSSTEILGLGAGGPPTITSAKQVLRRYPGYGDLVNILEFSVTDPSLVASFKIYRDSSTNLIKETNEFFYEDHQRPKDRTTTYFITCVGTDGTESAATVVSISPDGKACIESITGDVGGTIRIDASKNIKILGTSGEVAVTGDPATNTLTIGVVGASGGSAIDALIPDSGTSPVTPAASGTIHFLGGTNLTSVGTTNTITLNLDSDISVDTVNATTSVTTPTYTSSGADTDFTSDTNQNIVLQMGDAAGANKVSFTDSSSNEVASIDSDGTVATLEYTALGVNPVPFNAPASQDITLQMGDDGGTNKVSFTDSGSNEVASIDSNGTVSSVEYTALGVNPLLITAPSNQDIVLKEGDAAASNEISLTDSADVEWVSIGSTGISTFQNYIDYGAPRLAVLKDVKAAGTGGGTFDSGAWRTRDLNNEYDPDGILTLSSNQFTLGAGTYFIWSRAPAYTVDDHQTKLRNVTDGTDVIEGTVMNASATNGVNSFSTIFGIFTIGSSKAFEIQHQCETTRTGIGFGTTTNFAVSEVYTQVFIRKLRDT